ncbi:glutamate [NMDA] receptor subunit 1-like [Centruroides sculpturatus]|uniref:glutamate [NMDA] receptor subunit 1-like n=1 Tax=Centruroides sculpturatus TaxID=218467 RepID=UPI000C6EDEF1|nr:glutamate [NMDA] receptor subunit 1-like [Centruroides sculpturatus]
MCIDDAYRNNFLKVNGTYLGITTWKNPEKFTYSAHPAKREPMTELPVFWEQNRLATGAKNISNEWKIVGVQKRLFMTLDETEEKITDGMHFHVFKAIQQKLKFSYFLVKPIPKAFGYLTENGSWTGLIGKMDADMAFIGVFLNPTRFAAVEFTSPLAFQTVLFVIKAPKKIPNWISIIKPFGLDMWIAILSTLFIFGLVLHKVVQRDFLTDEVGIFWPRSRVFWNLFCTFVYQGINLDNVKRFKSRLLVLIWWLSVVVLISSYSGTLMSFMSYPLTESVPKTFDELGNAVKNGEYSCGTIEKGAVWNYFMNSNKKRDKILKHHILHHNHFLSLSIASEKVKEERFALLASESYTSKLIQKEPNAYIISEDVLITFVQSYAVRKGFPLKKKLTKTVIRMFEAGIIEKKDHSETSKLLKYSEFHVLQLADIISPIILLLIGFVLAIICLPLELFCIRIIKN